MGQLRHLRQTVHRGFALALGLIALANPAIGHDANLWWIDVRFLGALGPMLLGVAGFVLLGWAILPVMGTVRRQVTIALVLALVLITAANAAVVWQLQLTGRIDSAAVPFSAFVAGLLLSTLLGMRETQTATAWSLRRPVAIGTTAAAFVILFAVGQMYTFGQTDYRRKADAAVVFGARAFADGRLSLALADRVRTAVALYEAGRVDRLIMSGGPGDGDIHETEAMRDYAIALGVPPKAITLDRQGLNTRATVAHTASTDARLIAVSHFYHLPRIKMAYQQAGKDVLTMPATESRTLNYLPYYLAREVAAWWVYYTGPLAI